MAEPLTRGQSVFASTFARETGLNPRVVGAWLKAEQSGSAAQYYEKKGYHNWLNIARTDTGDAGGAHSGIWSNPESAARASAEWIKGRGRIAREYGAPAEGIRNILHSAGRDPNTQIQAIAGSGWASSGYNGGNTLRQLYGELSGHQLALVSAASRAAGAKAGIAPIVPEASTATQAPKRDPVFEAIRAIHTGGLEPGATEQQIQKNWGLLEHLFDPETPIGRPTSSQAGLPPEPIREGAPGTASFIHQKGVTQFDNKPVAQWIAHVLQYARAKGWKGTVESGFRTIAEQERIYNSGVRPAAAPGKSNHNFTAFPGGAVDVTNAEELHNVLKGSPYERVLIWAGAKDPVHFSHPHGGGY